MLELFLYPLSLLPLRILYSISDACYYLLYYIFRYRRKVVAENIQKSFPNLNNRKRIKIEKKFYKNFCDNFIEMLKLISMDEKELFKKVDADYSELIKLINSNQNAHIYLGHQFNWEWANAHIAANLKKTNIVVAYKPLKNKGFDDLILKMRSRFGSKMVAAKNLKKEMKTYEEKPHILILVADQNPNIPKKSYWTTFMSQQTAFISGTELYSASLKKPIFFANITKVKRGNYKFEISPMFEYSNEYSVGKITTNFAYSLESAIKKSPENYLWSHKRWKHKYNNEYKSRYFSSIKL